VRLASASADLTASSELTVDRPTTSMIFVTLLASSLARGPSSSLAQDSGSKFAGHSFTSRIRSSLRSERTCRVAARS
jgi:hypothetical protein